MPGSEARTADRFEAFYRRNYQLVYRVCYAFMKNAPDAEDCTEDTFVRVMTHSVVFENQQHERAWLTTTAMNICRDKLKHWWRQKVTGLDREAEQIAAPAEEHSEVVEAVMALPVKYKEVVWLHYFEGYQTDDIAAMLHRPPSTVRNQLRDARAKLKCILGDDGV